MAALSSASRATDAVGGMVDWSDTRAATRDRPGVQVAIRRGRIYGSLSGLSVDCQTSERYRSACTRPTDLPPLVARSPPEVPARRRSLPVASRPDSRCETPPFPGTTDHRRTPSRTREGSPRQQRQPPSGPGANQAMSCQGRCALNEYPPSTRRSEEPPKWPISRYFLDAPGRIRTCDRQLRSASSRWA